MTNRVGKCIVMCMRLIITQDNKIKRLHTAKTYIAQAFYDFSDWFDSLQRS